jgi:hypothetical protein
MPARKQDTIINVFLIGGAKVGKGDAKEFSPIALTLRKTPSEII